MSCNRRQALFPSTAMTIAGGRNQSPSNWAGTGPPDGGLGAADGVASFAEAVDWPHEETKKTSPMPSKTAIRRSVVIRVRVKLHLTGGVNRKAQMDAST